LRLRFRSLCALLAGFALLAGSSALAGDASPTLSHVVKTGELRVGMTGSQPPYNMKDKEGHMMGFEVDLASLLARSMEVNLKIIEMPFGKLLPALAKGDVDMVMSGVTITPARNMQFAFVGPYFVSGKSILTRSEKIASAKQPSDLDASSITVTALAGSTSAEFVRRAMPKVKLVATQDYAQAEKMVLDGKADAMVADFAICRLAVLRHPKVDLTTLKEPFTIEPIGVAVQPGDTLFVNLLTNYLGALQGTGALEALQNRWFEDGSWLARANLP
jgi:polar amino acid transport system substrate-binding protein